MQICWKSSCIGYPAGSDWKKVAQYVDVSVSLWGFDTPSLSSRAMESVYLTKKHQDESFFRIAQMACTKWTKKLFGPLLCYGNSVASSQDLFENGTSASGTSRDADQRDIRFDSADSADDVDEGKGGSQDLSATRNESISVPDVETGLQASEQGNASVPSRVFDGTDSAQTVPAALGKSMKMEMEGLEGKGEEESAGADAGAAGGWESYLATVSGALGSNLQTEFRQHLMSMTQHEARERNATMFGRRLRRDVSRRMQVQLEAGHGRDVDRGGPQASISSALLDMKKSTSKTELEKFHEMSIGDVNGATDGEEPSRSSPHRAVSQSHSGKSRMESLGIDQMDNRPGRSQGESWARAGLLSRTFSLLSPKERPVVHDDGDVMMVRHQDDSISRSISTADHTQREQGGDEMGQAPLFESR